MTTHPTPEALAACPFCGGNAQFNEHDDECYFTVLAKAKAAPKGDVSPMVELIPAWNRRTLSAELAAARAERDDLARWKSTHAPRIEALQGLKDQAQAEAAKGAEAIASLASEREANAILTAEVEALRAEVERLRPKWLPLADCPNGDVWFALGCGHVVLGYKDAGFVDWESSIDHDCCADAVALKAMPMVPPPPPVAEGV